ncbi:ATP-binding protein [Rhizobium lemnae]|uniref:ATP-binding protein n=1 Tax=Rhizobium lemnae TaxID=1214924 RepID=A0ABV8EBL4_9HYPH|nr:ATP-binding protein [Rhizobium lemnae]MCJ8510650.1 ATP-binding protein [Rhizobium lemnae]
MSNFSDMSIEDRKLHMELQYYLQLKDRELEDMVTDLVNNAKRCERGGGSKDRILFVIGHSDTGKSTALARLFKRMEAFQPYEDEFGKRVVPLLSIRCPPDCSPKSLADTVLNKWNLYAKANQNAVSRWAMIARQLQFRGIRYLHFDEMQHVNTGGTEGAILQVQDFVKGLTEIDDWPLHLILSGTPKMKRFMESDEVANRAKVQRFHLVKSTKKNAEAIGKVVRQIVEDDAGLQIGWTEEDELIARLIVASKGAFGTMIKITQKACFRVLDSAGTNVTIGDFAAAYKSRRGNLAADNPFTTTDWRSINPSHSLSDMD